MSSLSFFPKGHFDPFSLFMGYGNVLSCHLHTQWLFYCQEQMCTGTELYFTAWQDIQGGKKRNKMALISLQINSTRCIGAHTVVMYIFQFLSPSPIRTTLLQLPIIDRLHTNTTTKICFTHKICHRSKSRKVRFLKSPTIQKKPFCKGTKKLGRSIKGSFEKEPKKIIFRIQRKASKETIF